MALTRLPGFTLLSTDSYTFGNANVTGVINAGNLKTDNLLYANGTAYTFATSAQGSLADSAVQPGDLATIATTGSYTDLTNKPSLFDGEYSSLANTPSLFSGEYTDLANKPTLFSGSYVDLTNKPSLFDGEYASLANKPSLFSGSYVDLTNKPTLGTAAATDATAYATAAQGAKADTALQASNLTGYATELYVGNAIANLIDSAPGALDTLNELANALGDDANFAANLTNTLANKLNSNAFTYANITGAPTLGNISTINLDGNISNILYGNGVFAGAPVTYGDSNVAAYLPTYTGNLSPGNITIAPANLKISGGTADYVLKTDGAGNLSWTAMSGGSGGGASALDDLTDVTVATPANDQVLSYDLANTKWVNKNVVTSAVNSSYVTHTYTGDGTTTVFTVTAGTSTNSVIVTLSGIVQTPTSDYIITGTSLTFTTAPDDGLSIQIREIGIPLASGSNSQLIFNDAGVLGGNAYLTFNKTTGELVTSKIRVANVSNVFVGGGVAGQVLTSYGNGGVAWTNAASGGNLYITAPMTMVGDSFTGDGTTVDFTLSVAPSSSYYTIVTIGGVMQPRSYYTVVDNVITFSTAPPSPAPVEVTTFGGNSSFMGLATEVTNSSQPNITSVGTLSSLSVTGNVTANMFIGDGSLLTNISAPPALTAGTVTTNAQPNITGVGTLTSLAVTGNITSGNANLGNLVIANFHSGNGSLLSSITGANVSGTVANATYAVTAGTANSVAGANVSGTVAFATSATSATTAETVTTAAQPNITSTGTLSSLAVSGNATFSSWITLQQSSEVINTKNGATGTIEHDLSTGATFYHTSPSANFTANFTNVSTTDSRAIVTALVIIQGSTPYVANAVQIDGAAQTIKWIGSTAPTGTASKTDVISFTLMRVGGIWSVYGQYSSYG